MADTPSHHHELIVCGWDEVFILDMEHRGQRRPTKIWSWRAEGRADLPDDFHSLFDTTDECKPFDQGQKLLISSSGGAVVYVDREQDRVLSYARAGNAHSADLLPKGRIAVAASHDSAGTGDRLIIFDQSQPDQELWSEELPWGHGAVWDERRQLLWALSHRDLRVFELKDWETDAPKLMLVSTVMLPEGGGHDLYPVADSPYLSISTRGHVWLFDRDTRTMLLHPELGELGNVKCVSQHPVSRQLVYVKGEDGHWWSQNLYFLNPEEVYHVPGEHFYKTRWNVRVK